MAVAPVQATTSHREVPVIWLETDRVQGRVGLLLEGGHELEKEVAVVTKRCVVALALQCKQ